MSASFTLASLRYTALRIPRPAPKPTNNRSQNTFAASRSYRGDPGPSTLQNTKQRKARLLDDVRGGRAKAISLDGLASVLDSDERAQPNRRRLLRPPRDSLQERPRWSGDAQTPFTRSPVSSRGFTPRLTSRHSDSDPFDTSRKLREWIEVNPSPLSAAQLEKAIAIVADAAPKATSAPVWNMLFALLGREKHTNRMWTEYNNMKKRGIKPTSRTYTTLLNAYASVSHSLSAVNAAWTPSPPENKTLERVNNIHLQSQAHIQSLLRHRAPSDSSDLGYVLPSSSSRGEEQDEEVSLGPTNAYFKFLARYGMWTELEAAYLSMDREGPLAPDSVTFTTMFTALLKAGARRGSQLDTISTEPRGESQTQPSVDIGSKARLLWDQAVRRLGASGGASDRKGSNPYRLIDNVLAATAVECLMQGRPEDQRLAVALIPHLWSLTAPGRTSLASAALGNETASPQNSVTASLLPAAMAALPRLAVTVPIATTLLRVLSRANKPTLATHYARIFLSHSALPRRDPSFYNTAIYALSNTGEVDEILGILRGKGKSRDWPLFVWHDALTAARWAGRWDAALDVWTAMTGRPLPNAASDEVVDVASVGRRNNETIAVVPDVKAFALLFAVAAQKGWRAAETAVSIIQEYGFETVLERSRSRERRRSEVADRKSDKGNKEDKWEVELRKGLIRAAEILLEREKEGDRRKQLESLLRGVRR